MLWLCCSIFCVIILIEKHLSGNYLVELGENEELGDLEIVDLAEPTISVFAELLMEQDKMQVNILFIELLQVSPHLLFVHFF